MVNDVSRREVEQRVAGGAQVVEVLPRAKYDDAHLPRAINIPLEKLRQQAPSRLDKTRPIVVYCYDSLCDMSPRAAWLLESMGFSEVHNYVASKVDWIGAGLPFDGARADGPHLATLADPNVPTCGLDEKVADIRDRMGDWELCLVLNEHRVVRGPVSAEAVATEPDRPVGAVIKEPPRTYRQHVTMSRADRDQETAGQVAAAVAAGHQPRRHVGRSGPNR